MVTGGVWWWLMVCEGVMVFGGVWRLLMLSERVQPNVVKRKRKEIH